MSSLIPCLLLLANLFAGIKPTSEPEINYVLSVITSGEHPLISVVCTYKPTDRAEAVVGLPSDGFGLGSLASSVLEFKGVNGTQVKPGKDAKERLVTPNSDGQVSLSYTISFDTRGEQTASYGPILTKHEMQVFACQVVLGVGEWGTSKQFNFSFGNLPHGWTGYSSISPDSQEWSHTGSDVSLRPVVIGASESSKHTFLVEGKPVTLFLSSAFKSRAKSLQGQVEKIVRYQRDWFKDYETPYYLISINSRADNLAGIRISNCFACFIKPDSTDEEIMLLLSHEMCHNWIPGKISVSQPAEENFWDWGWFAEGVNDYFSQKLLLEAGIITRDRFVELINKDLKLIAINPGRNDDESALANAVAAGRFGTPYVKLFYYKGALIGAKWDALIKKNSDGAQSLDDAIKALYAQASEQDGELSPTDFHATLSRFGIESVIDRSKYILQGLPVELEVDAFAPEYKLEAGTMPSFEMGFDFSKSWPNRKIAGLIPGSEAEKAGLREGMELVAVLNGNAFTNTFRFDDPVSVTVKIGDSTKVYKYMQHGAKIPVFQYVKQK